jgi:membrane associated rhomboid family serine protease
MNGNRPSPFANITPVVKNLLIINLIFFLAYLLFDHNNPGGPVTTIFGAFYFNSTNFKPWQFLTYMFMHGGFEHILFNMFALFSFGPILEYFLGSKKFFNLYIICGLGAGVLQMTVQAIEVHNLTGAFTIGSPNLDSSYYQAAGAQAQQLYDIYHGPLVGASGAIFGLLVAFGMIYPNLELMILFIPVPVKAKYIIPVYILIELFSGFGHFAGDNVAHFAHLGGALIGFIMVKAWRLKGPEAF